VHIVERSVKGARYHAAVSVEPSGWRSLADFGSWSRRDRDLRRHLRQPDPDRQSAQI